MVTSVRLSVWPAPCRSGAAAPGSPLSALAALAARAALALAAARLAAALALNAALPLAVGRPPSATARARSAAAARVARAACCRRGIPTRCCCPGRSAVRGSPPADVPAGVGFASPGEPSLRPGAPFGRSAARLRLGARADRRLRRAVAGWPGSSSPARRRRRRSAAPCPRTARASGPARRARTGAGAAASTRRRRAGPGRAGRGCARSRTSPPDGAVSLAPLEAEASPWVAGADASVAAGALPSAFPHRSRARMSRAVARRGRHVGRRRGLLRRRLRRLRP